MRAFREEDSPQLLSLFRGTVERVGIRAYSPEQLRAWAPDDIPLEPWTKRFRETLTIVAECADLREGERGVVGFSNLTDHGCIDMLYVHADWQRHGIASRLYSELESRARELRLEHLHSDVSILARPFFLKQGFSIEREYVKIVRGVSFRNHSMRKDLRDG